MKMLVISPSAHRGGAEEYMLTIGSAAAESGWQVNVAFPRNLSTASLIQDLQAAQVTYYPLSLKTKSFGGIKTAWNALKEFRDTVQLLIAIAPDIVLINLPWPDFCFGSIAACRLFNCPTAVIFHSVSSDIVMGHNTRKAYHWFRAGHQRWITICHYNRRLLESLFQTPENAIQCIYNGADLKNFSKDKTSENIANLRIQLRQELGLSDDTILALTVGNLHPLKGYDDLLSALPNLVNDYTNVRFIWVGDGEERAALTQGIKRLGLEQSVLLLGYRSDVPRLMRAADLFVFPTRREGQPFVLLEAMANDLPIVSADAGGIPEMIEHKVHGLIFSAGDRDALEQSIRWALTHPDKMKQFSENGRSHLQNFSQNRMIQETLNTLKELHVHSS